MDKSSLKGKLPHWDMRSIIIGLALLLIFFATGVRFGAYLLKDDAQTAINAAATVTVDVKGAVNSPGVYQLPYGSRIEDALALAGVVKEAAPELLNRAAVLIDGSEVIVSYQEGEIDWNALARQRNGVYNNQTAAAAEATAGSAADTQAIAGLININKASAAQLQDLAGIGEVKAEAIIKYREDYGDFVTIEQLMNVSGIGEAIFNKIKGQICVE
jgi:competence protein ComEA